SGFPLLYRRPTGFLVVPVGRDAARGRISLLVLCSPRIAPRTRRDRSAVAFQPVHAARGVVPDLFRIRFGKDSERRSDVAEFHGDGQLLSERSAAVVVGMVRRTAAALVSRWRGGLHVSGGAGAGVGGISTASSSDSCVLRTHCAAGQHHLHRQLCLSQLSGSRSGNPSPG